MAQNGRRRDVRALAVIAVAAAGLLALPAAQALAATSTSAAAGSRLDPGPGEWWFGSWHVQQDVWPLTQGAGVTVAVLDTGVEAGLPDLRGVVLRGADVSDGAADGDGSSADTDGDTSDDGHGTAVADLIAGQGHATGIVGIAPRAMILPVKVGDDGADSVAAAAAGIRYAVQHGARVINMSFGGQVSSPHSCAPVLASAVGYALAHDVVLVAAAGDAAVLPGPMEPASCAGVLAVAGVGPDGSLWPGSTREPYVAVAAPGEQITFAGLDGRHSTTATGTSFSSALVAGAAALIRSRYPHMPWYQVDQRLTGTAAATGSPVPSSALGYGVVNLAKAVNAAAFPLAQSAPDPVYARYRASLASKPLATPVQHTTGQHGQAQLTLASMARTRAGISTAEIVAIAVGAVCAFGAVLVLVLRLPSRRPGARAARRRPNARHRSGGGQPRPAAAMHRERERETWSFGSSPDGYGGAPAHGRLPGNGVPRYWPNGAGGSSDGWSR